MSGSDLKNKWSILDSNTGEVNTPYYDEENSCL
mgnify:CR=1 FL=1